MNLQPQCFIPYFSLRAPSLSTLQAQSRIEAPVTLSCQPPLFQSYQRSVRLPPAADCTSLPWVAFTCIVCRYEPSLQQFIPWVNHIQSLFPRLQYEASGLAITLNADTALQSQPQFTTFELCDQRLSPLLISQQ